MKCAMCPRTFAMTRKIGFMDEKIFHDIIIQYIRDVPSSSAHVWLHHFGESLLHPKVADYVIYMQKRGVKAGISVNPIALHKRKAEQLIQANPYLIYISLDGHDEETFSSIRGVSGIWEQSKKNALYFLELKEKYKSSTQIVLSSINFPQHRELVETSKLFWAQQPGIDTFFEKPFTDFNGDIKNITDMHDEGTEYTQCTKPWSHMTIAWDGTVLPCCYDYDSKYQLGNITEKSLAEIWNDVPMQRLRQEFREKNVTCDLCVNCVHGGKWSRSINPLR